MSNLRLAHRYAKSIFDLAVETNQLEVVYADMNYLKAVCKASAEFRNLLASPIIKADKKVAIIAAIIIGKVCELTQGFTKLLATKGREGDLVEITNAFIKQYNELKQIHTVKLTTAIEISPELKNSIQTKANAVTPTGTIDLETKVDANLIGGFVLEFDNKLVDASVLRGLKDLKKQFLKNYYLPSIN